MPQNYWLIKSEPNKYSFSQLVKDKQTQWDGVRNFEARNNLRAMKVGDLLLFYHSNIGKEIVGIARVTKSASPDQTAKGEDWSVVGVAPVTPLTRAITLETIKKTQALKEMVLLRRSRLSVSPVTAAEFKKILELSETKGVL